MNFLLIPLFLILFIIPSHVFAQSQAIPSFDLGWKIKTLIDDFRENIADRIDTNWGNQIRLESTQTAQAKLEELLAQGKPVPTDLFQRVQEKVQQSQPIVNSVGQEIRDDLTVLVETNEIRKIVSDFQAGNYDKSELQARINALDSVQKKCVSVPQVEVLEQNRVGAYTTIKEQYCPILKQYDSETVLKKLYG